MKKKLLFAAIVSAVMFNSANAADDSFITIGTAALTSPYYAEGAAISKILSANEGLHHIKARVEATGGSRFNINAINKKDLDFGMAQSDATYHAYNGTGMWEGKPVKKLRTLFSVAYETVMVVAAEESGIKTFADLKNNSKVIVNLGNFGSGNRVTALDVINEAKLVPGKDFREEKLTTSESVRLIQDGRIDAFFQTGANPNALVLEATAGRRQMRFVPLDDLVINNLVSKWPYYTKTSVPTELYPKTANTGKKVKTIGMRTDFVTSEDTPDQIVYTITKEVFENLEQLKKIHPVLSGLTRESMLEGLTAPIHNGAMKYYKEKGMIR